MFLYYNYNYLFIKHKDYEMVLDYFGSNLSYWFNNNDYYYS